MLLLVLPIGGAVYFASKNTLDLILYDKTSDNELVIISGTLGIFFLTIFLTVLFFQLIIWVYQKWLISEDPIKEKAIKTNEKEFKEEIKHLE